MKSVWQSTSNYRRAIEFSLRCEMLSDYLHLMIALNLIGSRRKKLAKMKNTKHRQQEKVSLHNEHKNLVSQQLQGCHLNKKRVDKKGFEFI